MIAMGTVIINTISGTFCPGGANMFTTYVNASDAPARIKAGNHSFVFCPGGAMFTTYINVSDAPARIKADNHSLNAIKTPNKLIKSGYQELLIRATSQIPASQKEKNSNLESCISGIPGKNKPTSVPE